MIISDTGWTFKERGRCYVTGTRMIVIESYDEVEPTVIGRALTTPPLRPEGQETRFELKEHGTVTRCYDGESVTRKIYTLDFYNYCDSGD